MKDIAILDVMEYKICGEYSRNKLESFDSLLYSYFHLLAYWREETEQ